MPTITWSGDYKISYLSAVKEILDIISIIRILDIRCKPGT